jgi:hypothetical protein
MLMKSTPGLNFINVKCACFSYECRFGSFFMYVHMLKKAAKTTFVQKTRAYNVDEIDPWRGKMCWHVFCEVGGKQGESTRKGENR